MTPAGASQSRTVTSKQVLVFVVRLHRPRSVWSCDYQISNVHLWISDCPTRHQLIQNLLKWRLELMLKAAARKENSPAGHPGMEMRGNCPRVWRRCRWTRRPACEGCCCLKLLSLCPLCRSCLQRLCGQLWGSSCHHFQWCDGGGGPDAQRLRSECSIPHLFLRDCGR